MIIRESEDGDLRCKKIIVEPEELIMMGELWLLEGRKVNLRLVEKEDLSLLSDWLNSLDFIGRLNPLVAQKSKTEIEKEYDKQGPDEKWFFIEKKDATKVGLIETHLFGNTLEIGYAMLPSERGHGNATEAVKIMVDYLFLSKSIVRIGAVTYTENIASQKVLESAGFTREGTERKTVFLWGKWADFHVYRILREEWKEPKILTKTS